MTTDFDENCSFCAIAALKSPAYIVFEDDQYLAFLDKKPLFFGHTLLIPKTHYSDLNELSASKTSDTFSIIQKISSAIESAMNVDGTFIAINNKVSQSVPHFHVHIIPRFKGDGLKGFFWPRQNYRDAKHMQDTQDQIREFLKSSKLE